jgi:hypothetical protein
VLSNDVELDLDTLHVVSATAAAHGSVEIDGRNVVYTPAPDYSGADSFTVTIADEHGSQSAAGVTVTVTPVNDPPDATDDIGTTRPGEPVTLHVLNNDADVEGSPLAITSVGAPTHGTVGFSRSSVTYTPPPGFVGVDAFTYTISDGSLSAVGKVTVTVSEAPTYRLYLPLIKR